MQIHEREIPDLRDKLGNKRVVLGVGTFDLFHAGHMDYLRWADELAGEEGLVVVLVRTDDRVEFVKGRRPIIPEDERAYIVDNTKPVDYTFLGTETHPSLKPSIYAATMLRPDVVAMGDDWKNEKILWEQQVPKSELVAAPFSHRRSTTHIIKGIRNL